MINNEEYHRLRFWLNACCWSEMTISMGIWMIHWNEGRIIFSRRLEDGGLPAFHSRALKAAPFGLLTLQIRDLVGKIYNPQVWMEKFRTSWRVSMIFQANPIHVQFFAMKKGHRSSKKTKFMLKCRVHVEKVWLLVSLVSHPTGPTNRNRFPLEATYGSGTSPCLVDVPSFSINFPWSLDMFMHFSCIFHGFFTDCSWIFHCRAKWPEIFSTCRWHWRISSRPSPHRRRIPSSCTFLCRATHFCGDQLGPAVRQLLWVETAVGIQMLVVFWCLEFRWC